MRPEIKTKRKARQSLIGLEQRHGPRRGWVWARLNQSPLASAIQHLATLAACWRLDGGLDASADLEVAGYWCAEQAPRSVQICHHLHGGLGMDVTYPLHRFSSLVADLVRYLGGAEYRLERLACSST